MFHLAVAGIPHTLIHKYSLIEKIRLLLSAPLRGQLERMLRSVSESGEKLPWMETLCSYLPMYEIHPHFCWINWLGLPGAASE